MKNISPAELPIAESGACIIDVRTPAEFEEFHIRGAKNVPLDTLSAENVLSTLGSKDRPVYVLCRSGGRAKKAADLLSAAGFSEVCCVEGGSIACRDSGVACVVGSGRVISLERQVRIAAGTLVLLGVILGALVSPVFYGVSGFVGAGLIFAGVTDWCGLGMLIAKMPWNR